MPSRLHAFIMTFISSVSSCGCLLMPSVAFGNLRTVRIRRSKQTRIRARDTEYGLVGIHRFVFWGWFESHGFSHTLFSRDSLEWFCLGVLLQCRIFPATAFRRVSNWNQFMHGSPRFSTVQLVSCEDLSRHLWYKLIAGYLLPQRPALVEFVSRGYKFLLRSYCVCLILFTLVSSFDLILKKASHFFVVRLMTFYIFLSHFRLHITFFHVFKIFKNVIRFENFSTFSVSPRGLSQAAVVSHGAPRVERLRFRKPGALRIWLTKLPCFLLMLL